MPCQGRWPGVWPDTFVVPPPREAADRSLTLLDALVLQHELTPRLALHRASVVDEALATLTNHPFDLVPPLDRKLERLEALCAVEAVAQPGEADLVRISVLAILPLPVTQARLVPREVVEEATGIQGVSGAVDRRALAPVRHQLPAHRFHPSPTLWLVTAVRLHGSIQSKVSAGGDGTGGGGGGGGLIGTPLQLTLKISAVSSAAVDHTCLRACPTHAPSTPSEAIREWAASFPARLRGGLRLGRATTAGAAPSTLGRPQVPLAPALQYY